MHPILVESASRVTRLLVAVLVVLATAGGAYAAASAAKPSVPAPVIGSGPASRTNQTSATFTFSDSQPGVTFQCSLDGADFAACTSPKHYAGPLAQGAHSFKVRARNARGDLSAAASYGWTIDTTPPPAPGLTAGPPALSDQTSASFSFTDAESGVSFQCALDGGAFAACSSPGRYSGLGAGTHSFQVRALDAAGNLSAATWYLWTVQLQVSGFTLSGSLSQVLYPGATAGLNVRITNPFNFDINVSQLTVTVRRATTRGGVPNPGCDGTVNLRVLRQYGGPSPLKVKSSRTVSLSDLGVPQSQWPQLQMPDLPVNQDACKSTTFTFDYAATATKVTS
jgi:hypothetical protein